MYINGIELRYNSHKEIPYAALLEFYSVIEQIKTFEERYREERKVKKYSLGFYIRSRREARFYLCKLVMLLAITRRPGKLIKNINDYMDALGFEKESEARQHNPREALLNISSWFSVRLGKTPKEILQDVNSEITKRLIYEITKKELDDLMNQLQIKHDAFDPKSRGPSPFWKELKKRYNQLKNIDYDYKEDPTPIENITPKQFLGIA